MLLERRGRPDADLLETLCVRNSGHDGVRRSVNSGPVADGGAMSTEAVAVAVTGTPMRSARQLRVYREGDPRLSPCASTSVRTGLRSNYQDNGPPTIHAGHPNLDRLPLHNAFDQAMAVSGVA
jgi:hypothetical protein